VGGASLFAKKEKEIEQELSHIPFDVEILFLDEINI